MAEQSENLAVYQVDHGARGRLSELVPLDRIVESRTNPRRHFARDALAELTDSVRRLGVLQPIVVRMTAEGFEVVAGARRFRAAKAAGLAEIPAVVRDLSDLEVLEIQVVENLQRADLHPLEEARGYRQLIDRHGYEVEQLAAKVGKSRAYVYGRLQLCKLPKGAAKLFEEGKLDASCALLVARIPVPELAEQAAKEIALGEWAARGRRTEPDPMSYRDARDHVQANYMLRLRDAPWRTGDAELVPGAGACADCPKRTGNQRDLFGDVSSADVCTDPKCYQQKLDAHWERARAEAQAAGKRVLEGKQANAARWNGSWRHLDEKCWEDPRRRTWRQLLQGAEVETVVLRDRDGSVLEMARRDHVAQALQGAGHRFAQALGGRPTRQKTKEDREREVRSAAIAASVEDLVARAEACDGCGLLRFVAGRLMRGHHEPRKLVGKRRGLELTGYSRDGGLPAAARKLLDGATQPQLQGLIVELLAMDWANQGSSYGSGWSEACKLLGLDMRRVEARIRAERKEKAKAKAKAKGKRKAKKRGGRAAAPPPAVEESADVAEDLEERVCRECGCTDMRACDGGCSWVEEDLCSACAEEPAPRRAAPRRGRRSKR